jgi:hypothetical protein
LDLLLRGLLGVVGLGLLLLLLKHYNRALSEA